MNPTKYNHLFEYIDGRKERLTFLQSKVKKSEDIPQEYEYKAPRKLSNIEKYNWAVWLEENFPKVNPA